MEKKLCELFAGVGGFRLGLEKSSSDWETVWFSQWEPGKKNQWAHDCYVSHWGDVDEFTGIDIALVDKKLIPDHTLLVGGFPCQDYSVARPLPGSTGIEGKKGVLWWQIKDTLKMKNTPFILLENVDRLLKSPALQRGRDFGVMLACLAEMDYNVEWRVVNASDYGGAQRRKRVFLFAYKKLTNYGEQISRIPVRDVIKREGFFAKSFPLQAIGNISEVDLNGYEIVTISEDFKFTFENSGYMRDGHIYTTKVTAAYEPPIPLRQLLEKNVPEKFFLNGNNEKWKFLKGAKKLKRVSKSGHEYIFSEGPIAFPDDIDQPARTILTSESSLNRSTHVIQDPENGRFRLITPLEAERIQGFDDDWTNTGMPEKFRYFCMGNALVVPMITRMGKELNFMIENE
ncbi:MAG: DNA (cytosine-5-)-methyltransferase [Candidatus Gracilibacteria bacterium]|nr:DNA (cytosine-5-)-methyltransferase [Candidatus Gracilibacteria bacterium]